MSEFIARVHKEHADLVAKHQKLCDFIAGPVFPTLDTTDQHLLIMQCHSMETYLGILALRLERATPEDPFEEKEVPEVALTVPITEYDL